MSNDNVDYHSKYLKYKKKYLDLKNEIEGSGKVPHDEIYKRVAGEDLYTAGYKAFAGMIKGVAGVCMASKDTLAKFHATEISKTTAKKQLKEYQRVKGTAKTFGDLKKESKHSC